MSDKNVTPPRNVRVSGVALDGWRFAAACVVVLCVLCGQSIGPELMFGLSGRNRPSVSFWAESATWLDEVKEYFSEF